MTAAGGQHAQPGWGGDTRVSPRFIRAARGAPGNRSAPSFLVALLLWATGVAPAGAHEFWIAPERFQPAKGTAVGLRLLVGDGLQNGKAYTRNPEHMQVFEIWQNDMRQPVPGIAGRDPAGIVRLDQAGLAIAAYTSTHTLITLDAAAFENYLAEEGLMHIATLRAQRGDTHRPGREAFRRCAKSLIRVGGIASGEGHDRRLGHDLELITLRDPYEIRAGAELPVALLYRGEPLAGAQINLFSRGQTDARNQAVTDAQGRAVFRLPGPGFYLLSAVHMIPARGIPGADWESIWASLTFEAVTAPHP